LAVSHQGAARNGDLAACLQAGAQDVEISTAIDSNATLADTQASLRVKPKTTSLYSTAESFIVNFSVSGIEGKPVRFVTEEVA
jgi:hypothetical protein